jgi:hypothetical protein
MTIPAVETLSARLVLRDTAGVAKRNLLRIWRTPLMLIVSAVQPALLLSSATCSAARSVCRSAVTSTTSSRQSSWKQC